MSAANAQLQRSRRQDEWAAAIPGPLVETCGPEGQFRGIEHRLAQGSKDRTGPTRSARHRIAGVGTPLWLTSACNSCSGIAFLVRTACTGAGVCSNRRAISSTRPLGEDGGRWIGRCQGKGPALGNSLRCDPSASDRRLPRMRSDCWHRRAFPETATAQPGPALASRPLPAAVPRASPARFVSQSWTRLPPVNSLMSCFRQTNGLGPRFSTLAGRKIDQHGQVDRPVGPGRRLPAQAEGKVTLDPQGRYSCQAELLPHWCPCSLLPRTKFRTSSPTQRL